MSSEAHALAPASENEPLPPHSSPPPPLPPPLPPPPPRRRSCGASGGAPRAAPAAARAVRPDGGRRGVLPRAGALGGCGG